MNNIISLQKEILSLTKKYNLQISYIDITDNTLITRLTMTSDIFIQIYVNSKKKKINLALIASEVRIYGVDKEGGSYHKHPFECPENHLDCNPVGIEEFIVKSIEILNKKLTLL